MVAAPVFRSDAHTRECDLALRNSLPTYEFCRYGFTQFPRPEWQNVAVRRFLKLLVPRG
jgi:hypothetical protein